MSTVSSVNRRVSFFHLLDKLFSFSGIFLFVYSLSLLIAGVQSRLPVNNYTTLNLFLGFHFLYGTKWLQQVSLVKSLQSGLYYFSRRFTYVCSLFYFVSAIFQFSFVPPIVGACLFVFFVYYAGTSMLAFIADHGLIIKKRTLIFFKIIFVAFPTFFAAFELVKLYWLFILGVFS